MQEVAVLGGGCFWCTEAVFTMLRGVEAVESGYAGGHVENPTYEAVCEGNTGHAEVIRVTYNPSEISYQELLAVFFGTHDATQVNRQGNDVGEQYRSVIFYTTDAQKEIAERYIQTLNASSSEGKPIATAVEPLSHYFAAEEYHQRYFERNPTQAYCQVIIAPKLHKAQKDFERILKERNK
jgi:peptide-methionine (S)-S-oxide reductase